MPEDEQKSVSHLANFFCGLHALIHIAEMAEKAIREVEQGLLSTPQADEKLIRRNVFIYSSYSRDDVKI